MGWVELPAGYGHSALIWLLACEVRKGNVPVTRTHKKMNKTKCVKISKIKTWMGAAYTVLLFTRQTLAKR